MRCHSSGMPAFTATTAIAAPAARVRETLLRTDAWPAWDASEATQRTQGNDAPEEHA
jgi:hypothetical protein